MFEKDLKKAYLLDFYGDVLTERKKEVLDMYYNEDLSLAEIAEQIGISRQGVYDAIRRGARQLEAYEQQLGLVARYQRLTEGLREGLRVLEAAPGEQAQQARNILATLLSQEEE